MRRGQEVSDFTGIKLQPSPSAPVKFFSHSESLAFLPWNILPTIKIEPLISPRCVRIFILLNRFEIQFS